MTPDDVYEQWKTQRSSIEAPEHLASDVMEVVVADKARPTLMLERPGWAAVAMIAASFLGIMRVTLTLLLGIM